MLGAGVKIALLASAGVGAYLTWRRFVAKVTPTPSQPVVASSVGEIVLMDDPLDLRQGVRYRFRYLEPVIADPRVLFGPHTTLFRTADDLPHDWPQALGAGSSPDLRWGESIWEQPDAKVRRVDGVLQVWRA